MRHLPALDDVGLTIGREQRRRAAIMMDVVTARAMWIIIHEAVYHERSVRPDGSTLTLECDRGTGRRVKVRRDR
jgi:hypothetical protein